MSRGGAPQPGRWNSAGVLEALKLPFTTAYGEAAGIDDAGNAVGWASDGGYYSPVSAVLWRPGSATETVIDPCAAPGCDNYPRAMSRNGRVAGIRNGSAYSWTAATGFVHYSSLAGSTYSSAEGINDAGQVLVIDRVGTQYMASLISPGGVLRPLGTLPGTTSTGGSSINNLGQVAGHGQ
ncbi:MAG TPA: hypothetical protein VNJ04_01720 [Gemmatimonadaceae bacterium]|nr:hypothetical protein [Gemmatimonadaceae bacterium]